MSVHLDGLHLLVTYRCTYACDHCFVWGSPDAQGTMTLAQLTTLIDQAAACGIETVYFEGGEPTLAYPVVLAAAQQARRAGLTWGLVSNCFWATSMDDAREWLTPFLDRGIADLALSSYAYFVEDADEECLRNAVLAAHELGLPVDVLEVGAAAHLDAPGLTLGHDVGQVMYKGRAAVELAPGRAHRPPDTLTRCPHEDFAQPERAHVGCDGELQICQGISAGNVLFDERGHPRAGGLAAVLDNYAPAERPVMRDLMAGGPWALAQAHGQIPRRPLYADECDLCYEVRSALRRRFPQVLAPAQCYGELAGDGAS
jgi:Radical SAM superfamily